MSVDGAWTSIVPEEHSAEHDASALPGNRAWQSMTWATALVSAALSLSVVAAISREMARAPKVDLFWRQLRQLALADLLASAAWLALRGPWRATPLFGCTLAMALEEVFFMAAWLITSLIAATHVAHVVRRGGGEPRALALLTRCLLYTSPSPRDRQKSRMPSSA